MTQSDMANKGGRKPNRIPVRFVGDEEGARPEAGTPDENVTADELGRQSSYDDSTEMARRIESGEAGETGDVYIDGASNILAKPDFSDVERLRELFRTFEAKSRLVKILNECIAREPVFGDVHVVIGREHTAPQLRSCALITAPYRLGDGFVAGTVGVVGPMRLEYERTMAAVNYVARLVERVLREEARA